MLLLFLPCLFIGDNVLLFVQFSQLAVDGRSTLAERVHLVHQPGELVGGRVHAQHLHLLASVLFDLQVHQDVVILLAQLRFFRLLRGEFACYVASLINVPNNLLNRSLSRAHTCLIKDNINNDRAEKRCSLLIQSPHYAAKCFQHVRSSGSCAIVCKPRATHRAFITCNISCETWFKGTTQ